MALFDVQVIPERLKIDSREPLFVDGPVWLTLGGQTVPEAGWTDAVLSVLGSMGHGIATALEGSVGDFYFFDSPYFVQLIPLPDTPGTLRRVRVVAVDDRHATPADDEGSDFGLGEGEVLAEAVLPLHEVEERYSAAAEQIRTWALAHGEAKVIELLAQIPHFDPSDQHFTH
ncbi:MULTISPECIES: hypothetical protein [unclassified Streptomyces]|uniref:hypothetical protein n=1 Tax=unclassified Streptomyces TaxID=2593676 RepID=UPI0040412DBD